MGRIAKTKARGNGEGEPYPIRNKDEKIIGYAFILYVTIDGVRRSKKVERRLTKARSAATARAEVRAVVTSLRERYAHGEDVTAKPQTLEAYLFDWLDNTYAKKGRAAKSVESYRWAIKKVIPHIGTIAVGKVTTRRLDRFFLDLQEGDKPLAPKSVWLVRTMLNTAFAQAKKWRLRADNPVRDTDPPPTPRSRAKRLTVAQANAIAAAARGERLGLAVMLALALGMRRGEVCGLRWADIDFVHGTLSVNGQASYIPKQGTVYKATKTESSVRVIPLPAPVLRALVAFQAFQAAEREAMGSRWRADEGYLFVAERSGRLLRPDTLYILFRRVCARAGVSGFRLHDTRHTVASDLAEQGVDANTVAALLGHSSPRFTQDVYTHSSPKQIADAAAHRAFLLELPAYVEPLENAE